MDVEFLMIKEHPRIRPMISHAFRSFVLMNETEFLSIHIKNRKNLNFSSDLVIIEFDRYKGRYGKD